MLNWIQPKVGYFNFDGAPKENLGRAGARSMIHNKVEIIAQYASNIEAQNNNEAEVLALWEGLKICL